MPVRSRARRRCLRSASIRTPSACVSRPQGPQGPIGPAGPAGPTGATGAQGPAGNPALLPAGAMIFILDGQPVPAGFSYVGSFKQNLTDKGAANVVIKIYRKD